MNEHIEIYELLNIVDIVSQSTVIWISSWKLILKKKTCGYCFVIRSQLPRMGVLFNMKQLIATGSNTSPTVLWAAMNYPEAAKGNWKGGERYRMGYWTINWYVSYTLVPRSNDPTVAVTVHNRNKLIYTKLVLLTAYDALWVPVWVCYNMANI